MNTLWTVTAAVATAMVLTGVQVVEGDDKELANQAVDSIVKCPAKTITKPTGPFSFTLSALSSSGEKFKLDTYGFVLPTYTMKRDGVGYLERGNKESVLSFRLSVEELNEYLNYSFDLKSTASKLERTGSVSVKIEESDAFYHIKVEKRVGGRCKCQVELGNGVTVGECRAAVSKVPFFVSHEGLEDQVRFRVGCNLAKPMVRDFYNNAVFKRLKECVPRFHNILCAMVK